MKSHDLATNGHKVELCLFAAAGILFAILGMPRLVAEVREYPRVSAPLFPARLTLSDIDSPYILPHQWYRSFTEGSWSESFVWNLDFTVRYHS